MIISISFRSDTDYQPFLSKGRTIGNQRVEESSFLFGNFQLHSRHAKQTRCPWRFQTPGLCWKYREVLGFLKCVAARVFRLAKWTKSNTEGATDLAYLPTYSGAMGRLVLFFVAITGSWVIASELGSAPSTDQSLATTTEVVSLIAAAAAQESGKATRMAKSVQPHSHGDALLRMPEDPADAPRPVQADIEPDFSS